ncbi:MAG: hypothetical protein KDC10_12665, partial [Calditrichaeota bacterium]|nr:hypothetical protein [Calditrichota bacterium]
METSSDLNMSQGIAQEEAKDYLSLLESFPYRPTLFIGLGGTGSKAVNGIRDLWYKLISDTQKKGQKASVPDIDALYGFLAFDTARGERPQLLAENSDWFHLGVADLGGFYRGLGSTNFFKEWLVKNYPASSITEGAGGFRNIGRLALMANIDRVHKAIETKKSQIMNAASGVKVENPVPVVYVFGSLSGGTGSGMMLDLCFVLRKIFGSTVVVKGIVGVLDGLPSMPAFVRKNVRINTFGGLKELNAFMTGDMEGTRWGDKIQYPLNVSGIVDKPFNECYLIGPERGDGAQNLPTHSHVTSLMSRIVFMMSTFSFKPSSAEQTPDYDGIMDNNKLATSSPQEGTWAPYLVPGMAQVHFPIDTVVNIFALEAASQYLRYQMSGNVVDEKEVAEFIENNSLQHSNLRDKLAKNPKSNKGERLQVRSYEQALRVQFKDKKRYQHKEQILSHGRKIPGIRLNEIQSELNENLDFVHARCEAIVREKSREMLISDKYLGIGAVDFLMDLGNLLQREYDELSTKSASGIDLEYGNLEREWRQIESTIANVVTDDGLWDRVLDSFRLDEALAHYVGFLNRAELIVFDKALNELTLTLLRKLIESTETMRRKLESMIRDTLPKAVDQLNLRSRELHTRLHQQDAGHSPTPESICSINVMTQAWMDAYFTEEGLRPVAVLNNLLSQGLHPFDILSDTSSVEGDRARHVATQFAARTSSMLEKERQWTPMDVIGKTRDYRGMSPEEAIAKIFYKQLQPQMNLNRLKGTLGIAHSRLLFCGGVTPKLKSKLLSTASFTGANLNVAENHETRRINFFGTYLPVAMGGCDLICNSFEAEYNEWLKQTNTSKKGLKDFQQALYHCFPGSVYWPSPTSYNRDVDRAVQLFARTLALSEMHDLSENDKIKLDSSGKNPKTKKYGLFQYGTTQFWLCPFFTPDDPKGEITGKLIKLGSNVLDAQAEFSRMSDWQEHANAWINWFEENWSEYYN